MELVMKLTKRLPIIATGIISLTAAGQASASMQSCKDVSLHAEKLTLQAERYQKRAAELKPGEHDKYIRALKRRANSMRSKAMKLKASCGKPVPSHYRHGNRGHNHNSSHHNHFHY